MTARASALTLALLLGFALVAVPGALAAESAPKIESESVSAARPTSAILKAQIDPGGLETGYEFHLEYQCGLWLDEPCPLYCGPGIPEWEECSPIVSAPLPEGQLPPSSKVESVSLNLNKVGVTLHPSTKYRYWVEATNSAGTAESSKEFFTTPQSSAPWIVSEAVSNVGPREAILEAWINPGGLETTYELFLVDDNPLSEKPVELYLLASGDLPASYEAQHVTLSLNGVPADKTYDFAIDATNADGTAWAFLQLVTPPEEEPPAEPPEEEPKSFEEPPAEESGSPEEAPGMLEEGPGVTEEGPEAKEPPLHVGSPGAPQGEEAGPLPPPPTLGPTQGPPKAKRCHRSSHRRHHKARCHRP